MVQPNSFQLPTQRIIRSLLILTVPLRLLLAFVFLVQASVPRLQDIHLQNGACSVFLCRCDRHLPQVIGQLCDRILQNTFKRVKGAPDRVLVFLGVAFSSGADQDMLLF